MSIFRSPEPEGMAAVELKLKDYLELGFVPGPAMMPYRGLLVAAVAQATVDPALVGGAQAVRDAYARWAERYDIDPAVVRSLEPERLIEDAGLAPARVWLEKKARVMEQSPEDYMSEHFALSQRLINRVPTARKDKIEILPSRVKGQIWEHFRPIVDFCLANGCEISSQGTPEEPFTTDRGGVNRCNMYGPMPFQDILDTFALPESFKVVVHERGNYIEDPENRTTFYFFSEEQRRNEKIRGRMILEKEQAMKRARAERRARHEGDA